MSHRSRCRPRGRCCILDTLGEMLAAQKRSTLCCDEDGGVGPIPPEVPVDVCRAAEYTAPQPIICTVPANARIKSPSFTASSMNALGTERFRSLGRIYAHYSMPTPKVHCATFLSKFIRRSCAPSSGVILVPQSFPSSLHISETSFAVPPCPNPKNQIPSASRLTLGS
jgi:hypothetical protein